jgi:hypothetical protein
MMGVMGVTDGQDSPRFSPPDQIPSASRARSQRNRRETKTKTASEKNIAATVFQHVRGGADHRRDPLDGILRELKEKSKIRLAFPQT